MKGTRPVERGEHALLRIADGVVVLDLTGEHDLATSDEIRTVLVALAETSDLVVVDLTEATFVDSSLLENLVQAERTASSNGARLRVQLGATPIVRTAFEVSGLLDHFEVCETREEALDGFVDENAPRDGAPRPAAG
jgi:anti-anti-sigma factor